MSYLDTAVQAAKEAGAMLREQFGAPLIVEESLHHDIKLALDKKSQALIEKILLGAYPNHSLYGEEGIVGAPGSEHEWIVDPIDGTVNFFYGIPHFCVSIAYRFQGEIMLGVIYDPMQEEIWTVERGGPALLNGKKILVSERLHLEESILFVGCGKDEATLETGLSRFGRASLRARKMRMMGSAALAMAYIASGRLDAYVESRISLWDIAAGMLLVEAAGGTTQLDPHPQEADVWSIVSYNGKIPIEEIL